MTASFSSLRQPYSHIRILRANNRSMYGVATMIEPGLRVRVGAKRYGTGSGSDRVRRRPVATAPGTVPEALSRTRN